jgi:hypothetical protein
MLRLRLDDVRDGSPVLSDERGVILIQVGLALIVLLGFGAFAIDYGVLWLARAQAQNAADAGALFAATTLAFDNMTDSDAAQAKAQQFASQLPVWGQPAVVEAEVCSEASPESCPTVQGTAGNPFPLPEGRTSFSATVSVFRDQAHGNTLPTYLATLFGVPNQGVRAQATATVAPANVATCVWPLAMPDDWFDQDHDTELPLSPFCGSPTDTPCATYTRYAYPAGPPATIATPDGYIPPSFDSDDFTPTGYQLLELDPVMTTTAADPHTFRELAGPQTDDPSLWRRITKRFLVPVRIGGGGFAADLTSCNPTPTHVGDTLAIDPAATWSQATAGAMALSAQDAGAEWDGAAGHGTFRIRGSCARLGTCGTISPRLVLMPMFDPNEYDRTRLVGGPECGGAPCIKIVNFIGFFIDASTDTTRIVGHFTLYPGKAIDLTKPFIGYKWAFLRTAVLTR